jgi:hypothetical protein
LNNQDRELLAKSEQQARQAVVFSLIICLLVSWICSFFGSNVQPNLRKGLSFIAPLLFQMKTEEVTAI